MTEQNHLDFKDTLQRLSRNQAIEWPVPGPDIPHGDMPGDRIEINDSHIRKAQAILPVLLPLQIHQICLPPAGQQSEPFPQNFLPACQMAKHF